MTRCGGVAADVGGRDYYTGCKYKALPLTCSERVNCANAFRTGSSNSPFAMKTCTSASVVFLAGIVSFVAEILCTVYRTNILRTNSKSLSSMVHYTYI